VDGELAVEGGAVGLDGLDVDTEVGGDLGVAESSGELVEDVALAGGQAAYFSFSAILIFR